MVGSRALWVGTYTGEMGAGSGVYRVPLAPGGLPERARLAVDAASPSFLATHPSADVLYAVEEAEAGTVTAYSVLGGSLRSLGSAAVGSLPCHLSVQHGHLVVADYGSGTVHAVPLGADGAFAGTPLVASGRGSGPDATRQEGPHAHMTAAAPDGHVLATDLGADLVRSFTLSGGTLALAGETRLPAGCGPRHLAVHPSGHVYVVTELAATLLVLRPSGGYAALEVVAESAATASGGPAQCAAIKVGDGFVYTSARGPDVVTAHRILDGGAALEPVADVPSGGAWPRDLHVDGDRLYVANERGHTVTAFRIGDDGIPAQDGPGLAVPSPVCVIPA
ncbi:lactonase family protein [Spirillospora albida]|uniref:lactonase family protein n=1 Tax=Spirillospora albida TaxID=58123 RepID=UPI001FE20F8F|nr:beta-propeller fold lactonase family protein [Spirillospora albida]